MNDKVDVIISKERYEELLRKESRLRDIDDTHLLNVKISFIDTRISHNTLLEHVDRIEFKSDVRKGIPIDLQNFIADKMKLMDKRIQNYNRYREEKLDALKEQLRGEFKMYKKDPKSIPWFKRVLSIMKGEEKYA